MYGSSRSDTWLCMFIPPTCVWRPSEKSLITSVIFPLPASVWQCIAVHLAVCLFSSQNSCRFVGHWSIILSRHCQSESFLVRGRKFGIVENRTNISIAHFYWKISCPNCTECYQVCHTYLFPTLSQHLVQISDTEFLCDKTGTGHADYCFHQTPRPLYIKHLSRDNIVLWYYSRISTSSGINHNFQ